MFQVDTAGEVCNVNILHLLPVFCRIQKPVFKRLNVTPLIPVTTVLHTEVKLLKCFRKYQECNFLSKAVMYQERS